MQLPGAKIQLDSKDSDYFFPETRRKLDWESDTEPTGHRKTQYHDPGAALKGPGEEPNVSEGFKLLFTFVPWLRQYPAVVCLLLLFFFWPHAYRILVPGSGFKHGYRAVKVQSTNHWTAREVPIFSLIEMHKCGIAYLNALMLVEHQYKCFGLSEYLWV